MARPSKKTPEEKMRVVLSVLRGEATAAEAGRKAGVSEQTVSNWKRAFLDSGRAGLETGRTGSGDDHNVVGRVRLSREPVPHDEDAVGVETGSEYPTAEEEEEGRRRERHGDGEAAVAVAEEIRAPQDEQAEQRFAELRGTELGDWTGRPGSGVTHRSVAHVERLRARPTLGRGCSWITRRGDVVVGMGRFELPTPCSQSRCASQTAPHPGRHETTRTSVHSGR